MLYPRRKSQADYRFRLESVSRKMGNESIWNMLSLSNPLVRSVRKSVKNQMFPYSGQAGIFNQWSRTYNPYLCRETL